MSSDKEAARAEMQTELERLKRECSSMGKLISASICVPTDEYAQQRAELERLKAENEQLRIQFKRADLFGLEAILESEQLFKRSCEKLKLERDALEAELKESLVEK